MIRFKHRYVPFGIKFHFEDEIRPAEDPANPDKSHVANPDKLYANEVAVDIGGISRLLGKGGLIIDHHSLEQPDNLPASAVGVIRYSRNVHERLSGFCNDNDVVWLVTHEQPDFDALASCFLLKGVIDQNSKYRVPLDGWEAEGIVWDNPWSAPSEEHRWPMMLASYAACVDQCRGLKCGRSEALHAVLYAAIERRGRPFLGDGAAKLFQAATDAIRNRDLDPRFDALFTPHSEFGPELRLLKRDLELYRSDIARSRRCIVSVPQGDFRHILQTTEADGKEGIPLLDKTPDGKPAINEKHSALVAAVDSKGAAPKTVQFDGVFIRGPECLLFKEWARMDTENSNSHQGFVFTAIAYSNGRPDSKTNSTDYFFSLNPERAQGAHLYSVWMRLQQAEVVALQAAETAAIAATSRAEQSNTEKTGLPIDGDKPARKEFMNRSRGFENYFVDPWWDGENYEGTILATPKRGSAISPAGTEADLDDDPVAQIVSEEIEYSMFHRQDGKPPFAIIYDFGAPAGPQSLSVTDAMGTGPPPKGFRFAEIVIEETVDLSTSGLSNQLGRALGPVLEPAEVRHIPGGLTEDRVSTYADMVSVWNRKGIAVAYKKSTAGNRVDCLRRNLQILSKIAEDVADIPTSGARVCLGDGVGVSLRSNVNRPDPHENNLRNVLKLRIAAAEPDCRSLRQLMDAIKFDEIVEGLVAQQQEASSRNQKAQSEFAKAQSEFTNKLIGVFALALALPSLICSWFAIPPEHKLLSAKIVALLFVSGIVIAAIAIYKQWRRTSDEKDRLGD